jgi:hypothetical protein
MRTNAKPRTASIVKSERVLDLHWKGDGGVVFRQVDEDTERRLPRLSMVLKIEDWRAMGEPDTVTLTIRPGDHLNGEG